VLKKTIKQDRMENIKQKLLPIKYISNLLPKFMRECRGLFWQYIRTFFTHLFLHLPLAMQRISEISFHENRTMGYENIIEPKEIKNKIQGQNSEMTKGKTMNRLPFTAIFHLFAKQKLNQIYKYINTKDNEKVHYFSNGNVDGDIRLLPDCPKMDRRF
jgi:hypothetical protein